MCKTDTCLLGVIGILPESMVSIAIWRSCFVYHTYSIHIHPGNILKHVSHKYVYMCHVRVCVKETFKVCDH